MRYPGWMMKGTRGNLWEIHQVARGTTFPAGPAVSFAVACEVVDTLNGRARLVRSAAGERILREIRLKWKYE